MDAGDKKVLINSVSVVLIILVLVNVYRGATVQKIGIPGLMEIEFNTGDNSSAVSAEPTEITTSPLRETEIQNSIQQETQTVTRDHQPSDRNGQPATSDEERLLNIEGEWYGQDGSFYQISQTGMDITFTEYGIFGMTASGYGTLTDNRLSVNYETIYGTIGKADLQLSANRQILSGRANDLTAGSSTYLVLTKTD